MTNHRLAIDGGPKELSSPIAYPWPVVTEAMKQAALHQIQAGLSIYDKSGVVGEFEDRFRNLHGVKFGLVTSSGTAALHSAFYGLGLRPGDEVICPTYTFFATAMPLFQLGALPVLADCDSSGGLKAAEVDRLVTKDTRAVVVTHMWGRPCEMDAICAACRKHNLFLMEDCSHAHGASYHGQPVGTFGDAAAWSLQTKKLIAAGEGGILLTNRESVYVKAQLLGHFNRRAMNEIPRDDPQWKYAITGLGLKYRAHPVGIALALSQLANLRMWVDGKQRNARKLEAIVRGWPGVELLSPIAADRVHAFYALLFLVDEDKVGVGRDRLAKAIHAEGFIDIDIPTSTSPLHLLAAFQEPRSPVFQYAMPCVRGPYPNAELIASRCLKISVPVEDGGRADRFIEGFARVWRKVMNGVAGRGVRQ